MAKIKRGPRGPVLKSPSPQQQLAEIVHLQGSGRAVAARLKCSQQSVSAWALGTTLPRTSMQQKLKRLYGIPVPWTALP